MAEQLQAAEPATVSIDKACEIVGVSRRTIYNWIGSGKVQYKRTAGGNIRIIKESLWRAPDAAPGANQGRGDACD